MKKLFLLSVLILSLSFPGLVLAQGTIPPVPEQPTEGYILDTLNWLSPEQETKLNQSIAKLDAEGRGVIVVVTTDNCGSDPQAFLTEIFKAWKIGHVDDEDGLLLVVCWKMDGSLHTVQQRYGSGLTNTTIANQRSELYQKYFAPTFADDTPDAEIISSGRAGEAIISLVQAYDALYRELPANGTASRSTNFFETPIYGLTCGAWFLICCPGLIILYWLGIATRLIPRGTFTEFAEAVAEGVGEGLSSSGSDGGFGGGGGDGGGGGGGDG